ncbi:MAG TPA: UpxY family transcription antiterminator [Terracidiphilus sp.]|jgi:transcription antitermination factor NusG
MTNPLISAEISDFGTRVPHWYALYTNPRHEKVVARQLNERCVENFLPLYRTWHRWKDRRKQVELALFPGYIFVRIEEQSKLQVLKTPGAVNLVSFNGKLAALPESEIEALRNALDNEICAEPYPFLRAGRKVRVVRGPMAGAEGILARKKDKYRVVISVEVLMRSVALEIDGTDLEVV